MKRAAKNGWHKMCNFEVYVENGVVLYGILLTKDDIPIAGMISCVVGVMNRGAIH